MLGLASSLIPRIECNQSPRNTYQTAMTKQSVGAWLGRQELVDGTQFLIHAEQPLLQSNPNAGVCTVNGHNVLIAVSSYSACNQNDAIVMNQTAVDNGLFSTYHEAAIRFDILSSACASARHCWCALQWHCLIRFGSADQGWVRSGLGLLGAMLDRSPAVRSVHVEPVRHCEVPQSPASTLPCAGCVLTHCVLFAGVMLKTCLLVWRLFG